MSIVPILVSTIVAAHLGSIIVPQPSEIPSQATKASGPSLKSEIARLEEQIADAKKEAGSYSGGLVKALVEARIALLGQTLAMLRIRAAAQDFSVSVRYTVDGKPFVPPADSAIQLAAVIREIESIRRDIQRQQAEADKYSGGLVQAMALATVNTSRQTLAMLEQKRLALEFGLPQYVAFISDAARPASAVADPGPTIKEPAKLVEIVSVDARVTERNDSWWKYAWKLELRNLTASPVRVRATIEFQDKDGFVVDDDTEYNLVVPAKSSDVFTGYQLISMPGARNVARTVAKAQIER